MEYKSQLTVSIPIDLLRELDEARENDTRSHFIEKVVAAYLEEKNEAHD